MSRMVHPRWLPEMVVRLACMAVIAVVAMVTLVPPTLVTPTRAIALDATTTEADFAPTTRLEDDDPRMVFTGGWRFVATSGASGDSRRVSTGGGSVAAARFSGTGVALVSRTEPAGGLLAVSLDGAPEVSVELTAAAVADRARVWGAVGLEPGTHTLEIRAVEPSSSAEWVPPSVDCLLIEGTALQAPRPSGRIRVEESDRRLRFLGGWWNRAAYKGASKGRIATARASGAQVVVSFSGMSIAWLAPNQASGARAQITLDGTSQGVVSLARSGVRGGTRVMWASSGLKPGAHTLVLRAARAPATSSVLALDYFEIDGRLLEARPKSSFSYSWSDCIVIDKSDYRLYLVNDDRVVRTYPVAHGRLGWRTPAIVWRVGTKYFTWPNGIYGPRKLRLFKRYATRSGYRYAFSNYGIHGTNQPWVIGTMASHGCIRLYNDDVLDLFPRVPLGTMVVTRE